MKKCVILLCVALCACNSAYVKENTMTPGELVFADRGGFGMKRTIKEQLEKRGYSVMVGTAKSSRSFDGDEAFESVDMNSVTIPKNAKYYVKVAERREKLASLFCPFSGFWWWNFNVSIADQETGEELLSWRGRGCANGETRKLNKILDRMEKK